MSCQTVLRCVFICTDLCIAIVLFKLICSLLTFSLSSNFVQRQQLICKHCQNIFQLVCNFLRVLHFVFVSCCGFCFHFCFKCRSVNRIAVFKALAFRKKKNSACAWQLVCMRGLKEDALQSQSVGNCQIVGISFPMGYMILSKGNISPKIGRRQTTNQFSFVLYASLKKKMCNIM